ncbi:MAG TPA: hypothetical protein VFL69_09530 [Marmoricola sp.]|nr:hypothetical protein [Marmoricola sp.]
MTQPGAARASPLLRLTQVISQSVPGPGALEGAGRVLDLVADLAHEPPPVTRVVREDDPRPGDREAPPAGPPVATEVWLVRDVLDAPVFDVGLGRMVRVGEVWLLLGPGETLLVAALEVGPASTWHRLLPRRRRSRSPTSGSRLLDFGDVHLASQHGHQAQLAAASSAVHRLDEHQLAELLTSLPVEMAADVVRRLPEARTGPAVSRLHPHVSARLARGLGTPRADVPRRARRTAGWRRHGPGRAG